MTAVAASPGATRSFIVEIELPRAEGGEPIKLRGRPVKWSAARELSDQWERRGFTTQIAEVKTITDAHHDGDAIAVAIMIERQDGTHRAEVSKSFRRWDEAWTERDRWIARGHKEARIVAPRGVR